MSQTPRDQNDQKPADSIEPASAARESEMLSDEALENVSGGRMTSKNEKSPFDSQ